MSDSIVIEESNGEIIVIEPTVVINQNAGVDQIPADWNQADNTKPDFIKNKPVIPKAPAWGEITGDIADQQDLVTELEKRQIAGETVSLNENQEINFNGKASIQYHKLTDPTGSDDSSLNINAPKVVFSGEVNAPDSGRFATKADKAPTVLPPNTDINTVVGNGVYAFDYTATNRPSSGSGLLVVNQSGGNISQTAYIGTQIYNRNTDELYMLFDHQWVAIADTDMLNTKVDKIPGKSLSTNDYTTAEKTKLNAAVTSSTIATIVTLTQTAYDALNPKVATTLYIITGA